MQANPRPSNRKQKLQKLPPNEEDIAPAKERTLASEL